MKFICFVLMMLSTGALAQHPVVLINTKAKPIMAKVPPKNEKLENAVLNNVGAVPEVKEFMRNAKKEEPALMISGIPKPRFKYYWVQVGISSGGMFRSTINYCVDPKTLKVYYWDEMADDRGFSNSAIISLSKWRTLRKTAGWQKRHTYKHGKLVVLTN